MVNEVNNYKLIKENKTNYETNLGNSTEKKS